MAEHRDHASGARMSGVLDVARVSLHNNDLRHVAGQGGARFADCSGYHHAHERRQRRRRTGAIARPAGPGVAAGRRISADRRSEALEALRSASAAEHIFTGPGGAPKGHWIRTDHSSLVSEYKRSVIEEREEDRVGAGRRREVERVAGKIGGNHSWSQRLVYQDVTGGGACEVRHAWAGLRARTGP